MDNIYDIRYKENLYYIFQKRKNIVSSALIEKRKAAVFASLYYETDVEWYLNYLRNIPEEISLFVFSSNKNILAKTRKWFMDRENFKEVGKENRGRDISALLIAGKDFFFKFDYICFVHDKEWRDPEYQEETKQWRYNLWENTLGSMDYIEQIIEKLQMEKEIGLLCPPEPSGEKIKAWYTSAWADCYEETIKVAERLKLQVPISPDKPPISLSTVFWCRTDALAKLVSNNWEYEDFLEEPLPRSGTVSHGIERVLAYVAQDAGYKTAMVMTDEYAGFLLSYAQHHLNETFRILSELWSIGNLEQLRKLNEQKDKIIGYFTSHNAVYLYGAGIVGRRALKYLRCYNCKPKGFLVSDNSSQKEFESIPVFRLHEIEKDKGIIVTVSKKYQDEIVRQLKTNDINDFIILD